MSKWLDRVLFNPVFACGLFVVALASWLVFRSSEPGAISHVVSDRALSIAIAGILGYCILACWFALDDTIRKAISKRDSS